MIWFLRFLFIVVIVSMLGVTTWASLHQPLGDFARSATFREPWVIATLFDAYWAFITFFVWLAWKEGTLTARVLWFVSVVLLGNLAMAAYMLRELFTVSASESPRAALTQVFTHRHAGRVVLPGVLTALSIGVYLLA
ncbi:MAG TPA: DUF1475 family protein [Acidobacteriota bacterium]|nr:DUF1475 family protein [Acidobacteriota bacterium]